MTIETRIATNNSKVDTANETSTATTYTTKAAKNGAINFYSVETGKRVKEADIVAEAIENGGIFYAASVHGYDVDHVCSKEFASPITAYKWICRMARKSNTYADGDACITVGFCGELIYTQKHSVNEIKNAELRAYVEAEMAEQIAEADNNEREDLIHAQMHNNNLTREQAEQITDYLRANRQNYNAEIAATAKAMLDNYKKINNPETATVNNAAEHTPVTVEEKAEVIIPIVDYRTLLTWAEKVSNGQHDTAIQIVTHIKKWFNAETDKKTVIEVIKAGDLNGFRNFLCQFNFVVKDDGGCIHKLYRYDNGECVLAEIPTSEYAKYSVEETEAELPKGDITVESGAEVHAMKQSEAKPEIPTADDLTDREKFLQASKVVITVPGRHIGEDRFATKWVTLCPYKTISKATAGNILATFGLTTDAYLAEKAKWVADEIKRGSRQFAIDCQAEFLRDKTARDSKASVEPLPVFIPAEDSDDDELIDTPELTPADDFVAKLAELKAKQDAAKTAELAAKKVYDEASDKYEECRAATQDFLDAHAEKLTEKIKAIELESYISLVRDNGKERCDVFSTDELYVDAFNAFGEMFIVYCRGNKLGNYDTPAQVETVIERLKAAIERGDREFTFPTIEELTKPEVNKDATADSLTRAMNIALEHYKGFCHIGNLTKAEHELKLYEICRKATRELWEE